MNETAINWDSIPDIITKDQLYQICHISKSTALYLLRSGKIPCEYTRKKTRCYKIKKADVITYLFKAHPDRRTQIRAKAERYRKITLCRVYFWFCLSTLSKTAIPCKQGHYKASNHRVHFWKRISAKIIVRVHFWKNNFCKNIPHVYFWKSKSKINIFRVYFSWLLQSKSVFAKFAVKNGFITQIIVVFFGILWYTNTDL